MRVWMLAFATIALFGREVTVDLSEPSYDDGVITTKRGGVVSGKHLRIQGREIRYDSHPSKRYLVARGDLLIEYGGRYFVGDQIEYDFNTKTGTVYNARTALGLWFLGAKSAELSEDGSYQLRDVYITTSPSVTHAWEIKGRQGMVYSNDYAYAKNVTFLWNKFPLLWLPSLKSNLGPAPDTPVRYRIVWDKGQGPRLSARYRVYSWENTNIYARLDVRPNLQKLGIAGALEADHTRFDDSAAFVSRNFVTKDTFFNDTDPGKESFRFRAQGLIRSQNALKTGTFRASWDWFDDKNLPLTFTGEDFELNDAKRTELLARHIGKSSIGGLYFRPRINSFQGFKQELPSLNLSLKPIPLGSSGVISENRVTAAYLNYVYSDDINGRIPDFRSTRLSMDHNLYRAFHTKAYSFTPLVGFTGIYYNESPEKDAVGQAVFRYNGLLNTKFDRRYASYKHRIEPYLFFQGLSVPTISIDDVFIYGIDDGWHQLNQLRVGVKNVLFSHLELMPTLSVDFYANAFFKTYTYKLLVPKTYLDVLWNLDNLSLGAHTCWNSNNTVFDYTNLSLLWTVNADFATYLEFRHRSRFDWRKDNHQNFILDVSRSIDELLDSPLSDGRNTFLTRLQYRIHPEYILRLEMHQGWGRKDEPGYNEGRLQLLTMVTDSWRLTSSFTWTVRTKNFTGVSGILNLSNKF